VYGIWWIGAFVVFMVNFYFFGNSSLLKHFRKDMGYLYYLFLFREADI